MSVAPVASLPHPLVCAVEQIEGALDGMPIDGWSGLEPVTLRESAERLMRVEARVKAQLMAVTRALDETGLAKASGASSTGAMLAGSFGGDRRAADGLINQAKELDRAPATEDALARGAIGPAQAAIIAKAVAELPDDTTPEQKQACEDTLIGDAGRYSLKDLRSRSKRITDQFKPEPEVDQIENANLESQEKDAWRRSEFWMVNDGDGTCRGGFRIPEAQADMLRAAIEAISAPRRDHLHDHTPGAESYYDKDLEHRHRLGMGFAELCNHLPGDKLPGKGGLGATLMVRFDFETLLRGIKPATLSTGTRISAGQARQMACRLGMIPQVFDGKSLPLDHGHEQRLFTKTQRQALENRDGGCTFPECDRPPEWCEAHHWRMRWADGSDTTLDDGVLICPFHHRTIHDNDWAIRMAPVDGHPEYRAPGSDAWKRNHRWRP
ncbi:HNH endonuclease signature motif containing protein [Aeromicrobium sp.]|uniref:HNH endonuclease signature motif containing protein n=1 Tax=Aeromicrobium sp. TaxID=1871063 RepID=UPI002FC7064C